VFSSIEDPDAPPPVPETPPPPAAATPGVDADEAAFDAEFAATAVRVAKLTADLSEEAARLKAARFEVADLLTATDEVSDDVAAARAETLRKRQAFAVLRAEEKKLRALSVAACQARLMIGAELSAFGSSSTPSEAAAAPEGGLAAELVYRLRHMEEQLVAQHAEQNRRAELESRPVAPVVAVSLTLADCDAPLFSGTADPKVPAEMFSRLAQRFVQDIPENVRASFGDTYIVQKIVKRLTGDALLAYQEASRTATLTLVELWAWLKEQEHHDAGFHARRDLNLCKQGASESVEAYIARFRGLIAALPAHPSGGNSFIDDRDGLQTTFRLGLLNGLSDKLIEKAPFPSTEALFKVLRNIWAVKHPVRAPALNVAATRLMERIGKAAATHAGQCFCCGDTNHIMRHCPKKTELPRKQWLFDPDSSSADF
jgi:hypothetical protein